MKSKALGASVMTAILGDYVLNESKKLKNKVGDVSFGDES